MYRIAFLIAIFTGCRVGEITGITWADLYQAGDSHHIHINKAACYEKGAGTVLGSTKTDNSKRPAFIPTEIMDEILVYKIEELERRKAKGYDVSDEGHLFIDYQTGKMISPVSISNNFKRHLKMIPSIKRINFHGLRHSFITLLLRNGVPLDEVSKIAGHCNVIITSKSYGHVLTDELKKSVAITRTLLLQNRI